MKVAIVLAREGSKRILKKNIKEFCGRPIISWTISKLIQSNLFHKIIVSTDSEEIANISRESGAEVPFIRPKFLADDHATTLDVMHHAVQWLTDQKIHSEVVCCSYATSVFLNASLLEQGITKIEQEGWQAAMSVVESSYPLLRSLYISDRNGIEMVFPDELNTRSQDLRKTYHDAAQFYIADPSFWLSKGVFYSHNTFAVRHSLSSLIDIDNVEDWAMAELIFKSQNLS